MNTLLTMCDKRVLLIAFITLSATACVPEPSQHSFPDQDISQLIGKQQNKPSNNGKKLGDGDGNGTMNGTWLVGFLNSSCVLGNEQVGIAYQLVEVTQTGNQLSEKRTVCGYELSEVLGVKPVIPANVVGVAKAEFPDKGYVTRNAVHGGYSSPTVVLTYGLKLADPQNDTLPTSPTDPRVIDADNDGNPGVSFEIQGKCSRYTAQRQVTRFQGSFETPNLIRGTTIDRTDAVVFGGSATFCEVSTRTEPNDHFSEFAMARIDGAGGAINADKNGDGTISCDEVKEYFPQIMPVREPIAANCAQ